MALLTVVLAGCAAPGDGGPSASEHEASADDGAVPRGQDDRQSGEPVDGFNDAAYGNDGETETRSSDSAPEAEPPRSAEELLLEQLAGQELSRGLPVVLVHGYNFWATSDTGQWARFQQALTEWGWDGGMSVVRFYGCDGLGSLDIADYGSHGEVSRGPDDHASNCEYGHDYDTLIDHLGYHLAWALYEEFTAGGQCVVVVAHSMGGLLLRYAIAHGGDDGFPPFLCVRGAATLGTPHLGQTNCGFDGQSCTQMQVDSAFVDSLPQAPEGIGGTKWVLVGSEDDWTVEAYSASGVAASSKVNYLHEAEVHHANEKSYLDAWFFEEDDVGGGDAPYYGANDRTAWVQYADGRGKWVVSHEAPWPARWVDLAFASWDAEVTPPVFVPYAGQAIRVAPNDAAVAAAAGQDVDFQGQCRDPEGTLVGAQWQLFGDGEWHLEDTDAVWVQADPWTTGSHAWHSDSDFRVRVVCVYANGDEASIDWAIHVSPPAGSSGGRSSGGQTLATDAPLVISAEQYHYKTFTVNAGQQAIYNFATTDFSALDSGIIRHADLHAWASGQDVESCGYASETDAAEATCNLAGGTYDLVFYCWNSFADCDIEYTLYTSS